MAALDVFEEAKPQVPVAEALRELVELKDGPRDAEYERRKLAAWERARQALAEFSPSPSPTDSGRDADVGSP
jgi:hypothetical protein